MAKQVTIDLQELAADAAGIVCALGRGDLTGAETLAQPYGNLGLQHMAALLGAVGAIAHQLAGEVARQLGSTKEEMLRELAYAYAKR